MMGPVLPVPVPAPLADALTAVQVTTTAGQSSGFQLTFAVSKDSVIQQVMLPTGALDPGLRVILVILLTGSPTVLMDGIVTRQDLAPSDTPGGSTLTLTGEDLSVLMSLDSRNVCYPGLSTEARVAVICARYAAVRHHPRPGATRADRRIQPDRPDPHPVRHRPGPPPGACRRGRLRVLRRSRPADRRERRRTGDPKCGPASRSLRCR